MPSRPQVQCKSHSCEIPEVGRQTPGQIQTKVSLTELTGKPFIYLFSFKGFFFNFLVVIVVAVVALDHLLKVFTEFVTILVLFLMGFWYFGHEACGILAPRPGTKPLTSAAEGQVLAAGPP